MSLFHSFFRKSKKMFLSCALISCVLVLGGIAFAVRVAVAAAVIDEEDTVHIKDSDIEEATLIIGTHLIYLGSMTDALYKEAQETRSKSAQSTVYYKSELADGAWFDLGSASGIGDISYAGTPVEVSVIEALNVRYHTKSDGITYDLMDGSAVCVFDLNDPYDISGNSDLEELTSAKELLDQKEGRTASDNYYLELLEDFYAADITTADTAQLDASIDSLQEYYRNVSAADRGQAECVMDIMKRLDSTRRALVNEKLSESLSELLDKAAMPDSSIEVNDIVVNAIAAGITNNEASSAEYEADRISDGTQIYTRSENAVLEEIINAAAAGDGAAVSAALDKFEAVRNIENGIDSGSQAEIDILNGMVSEAYEAAAQAVSQGEGEKYKELSAAGASAARLAEALKEQKNGLEQVCEQLAYLNKSMALRLSAKEATEYLERQAKEGEKLLGMVPEDAFAPYAREAVNGYLNDMEKEGQTYAAGGSNVLDKLLSEKEGLELERRKALDKNDLEGVRDCDRALEEKERAIADREAQLNAIVKSPLSTSAEKADAQAELESSAVSGQISTIREKALADIEKDAYEYVSGEAEAIAALSAGSPETAKNALTDIYRALVLKQTLGDGLSKEQMDTVLGDIEEIEQLIMDNKDIFIGNSLNEETVYKLVQEETGVSFYDLEYRRQAAVLEAVYELGDHIDSSVLENIAASMASYMYSRNNPYVFLKLRNEPEKYIPLENLARCTDYRYIYSDSLKEGILQRGLEYYRFEAFLKEVIRAEDVSEEMEHSARLQNGLYIPEEYAQAEFACRCSYIYKSDYSVMYSEAMREEIDRFYQLLSDLSL